MVRNCRIGAICAVSGERRAVCPLSRGRCVSAVRRELGRHHVLRHGRVHDPGSPCHDRRAVCPRVSRALVSRLVCLGVVLVLGFHLFNVFRQTYGEATLRSKSRQLVEQELLRFPGSSVVDVTLRDRFGPTSVFVVVKSPHAFTSEEVGHINDSLNAVFGEPVDLHMRSEMFVETTRDGAVPAAEVSAGQAHSARALAHS